MHPRSEARVHARWLWALLGLFLFRVVAQPLALAGVGRLPAFDAWHSGVLPYSALLTSQLLILGVLLLLAWQTSAGRVRPRSVGIGVLIAGGLYMSAMVARLLLGATVLRGHPWFARPLPTTFHLVLAGFLLVYGHFHFRHGVK